jgi:hypothetical protein
MFTAALPQYAHNYFCSRIHCLAGVLFLLFYHETYVSTTKSTIAKLKPIFLHVSFAKLMEGLTRYDL